MKAGASCSLAQSGQSTVWTSQEVGWGPSIRDMEKTVLGAPDESPLGTDEDQKGISNAYTLGGP
jgi:hypothetical protein